MKIKMDGTQYTTRDGRAVRIYAVDHNGKPVHGAMREEGCGWGYHSWYENGRTNLNHESGLDLIEKPKTVELDLWLNLYEYDNRKCPAVYFNKASAIEGAASNNRKLIACVNIKRTVTEGEGL